MIGANVVRALAVIPVIPEYSPKWVEYWMKSPSIQNIFQQIATTSVQATLNLKEVREIEIPIPNLEYRNEIIEILSALDSKIENNLAINKTLEEMAMALYKHWFVDFGPFQDGGFVESEIFGINNSIKLPKTFSVLKVKDEINRLRPSNKYTQENVEKNGKIRVFDQSNSRLLGYHNNNPDFKANFENPIMIFGDHTCRMELVSEDFSVGPNVIPFNIKQQNLIYLIYLGLKEKVRMNDYKRHWSELMLHEVIIPNEKEILEKFNFEVKGYFNLINKNEFENQTLTQLRDTLLPKLISGEIQLKEFREQVKIEV
jgi:type I restriction enzyme S subunit